MKRAAGWAITWVCAVWPAFVAAEPPAEYTELLETARGAHAALDRAPDEARSALRDFALDSDLALLEWLDGYVESDAFAQSPDEEQNALLGTRVETELALTDLLVEVGRCPEAHDRLVALAARDAVAPWVADLRPVLESTMACMPAQLVVRAYPENATVSVDGVPAGTASEALVLPTGSYLVRIEAPGYRPEEREVTLDVPGAQVTVGPVYLTTVGVPPDRSALPRWHEWTLLGVGAVAIGVGVGYLMGADDVRTQLGLTFRGGSNEEFVASQQDDADTLELIGWIVTGAGVASVGTGVALYVARQLDKYVPPEAEDRSPSWWEWSLWGVAAAGFGWGAATFTESFHRRDYADAVGQEIGENTAGAEGLRDRADELVVRGSIITTAAVCVALAGTVSYVIRTADPDTPEGGSVEVGASLGPDGAAMMVSIPF